MTGVRKTYPEGARGVIDHYELRRDPLVFSRELLPPHNVDLSALKEAVVPPEAADTPPPRSGSFAVKKQHVAREFIGNSQLAWLNAVLIATLRRREQPDSAAKLFQRIWREQSDHLIDALNMRWKVSSVITFADHGVTCAQRELGRGLQVLFGMIKLYEFERTFSRLDPDQAWPTNRRKRVPLAMEMDPYSLRAGGLDTAILAPLWEIAMKEPVAGPLACHLLDSLNSDSRNVFRRLSTMREEYLDALAEQNAAQVPEQVPDPNAPSDPETPPDGHSANTSETQVNDG